MNNSTDKRTGKREAIGHGVTFELNRMESGRLRKIHGEGKSIDLSPGGIGMISSCQLNNGEVVKLMFPLTEGNTKLPVFTQVIWTSDTSGEFRTGLRFLS